MEVVKEKELDNGKDYLSFWSHGCINKESLDKGVQHWDHYHVEHKHHFVLSS